MAQEAASQIALRDYVKKAGRNIVKFLHQKPNSGASKDCYQLKKTRHFKLMRLALPYVREHVSLGSFKSFF